MSQTIRNTSFGTKSQYPKEIISLFISNSTFQGYSPSHQQQQHYTMRPNQSSYNHVTFNTQPRRSARIQPP